MKFTLSKLALTVPTTDLSLASVMAQEAASHKNLSQRLPNLPKLEPKGGPKQNAIVSGFGPLVAAWCVPKMKYTTSK